MQAIGDRFPKNGVHIQKIVPKQLFDGGMFRGQSHVGMIFNAPEIEDQTVGAKLAFHPPKSVRRLVHVSQRVSYFVDRLCSGDDQVHVYGLAHILGKTI